MTEFRRVDALPPYAFAEVERLKLELRHAGEDVIDLGFGNPDVAPPDIAVEKLREAALLPRNHRYSSSRGLPNLRAAVSELYRDRYGVELDPETEITMSLGAKEGLVHLLWVLLGPGDVALVPSPSYPIHLFAPGFAGAAVQRVPALDFVAGVEEAWETSQPRPRVLLCSFPHNRRRPSPTGRSCSGSSTSRARKTPCSCTTSRTPTSASTATGRRRSSRPRGRRTSPSSSTR